MSLQADTFAQLAGPWLVRVPAGPVSIDSPPERIRATVREDVTLTVPPADVVEVHGERYDSVPIYNPEAAPWARGARLRGLITFETTMADALVAGSLVLKTATGQRTPLQRGLDYELDERWATFGRLPGGKIPADAAIYADYRYGRGRHAACGHAASACLAGRYTGPRQYLGTRRNTRIDDR
jgi:hypothetical protein